MKKMPLWGKIFIGFALGIIVAVALKLGMGEASIAFSKGWLKPFGEMFLNLIKMLIVPLVFSSLFVGASSIGNPQKLGRVGGKTVVLYLFTTFFAVSVGLLMGKLFSPGLYVNSALKGMVSAGATVEAVSPLTTILNIIPKNPIAAMSSGNILQIILFALFAGVAASLIGEKGKPVIKFMTSAADIMYKITEMVMSLAPIGVFFLIADTICSQGLSVLAGLFMVIVAVYVGSILNAFLVYGGLVKFAGKMPLFKFFKAILPAQLIAFSTCSSAGTLPATMECNEENLGVSKNMCSFILPLGATINMDGTSLYQGVCVYFVAQVYGIDLTGAQLLTIVLTGTLASIGTAGVPGAGLIMLSLILNSIGLPLEGVAMIAGIDRILDMARTTLNITGDSVVNFLVAKSEGEVVVVNK